MNEIEYEIVEMIKGDIQDSRKIKCAIKKNCHLVSKTLEELYSIANNVDIPFCQMCNNKVKLFSVKKGFRKYCSVGCYRLEMSLRNSKNNEEFNKIKSVKIKEKHRNILEIGAQIYKENNLFSIKKIEKDLNISTGRLRAYLKEKNLIDYNRKKIIQNENNRKKLNYAIRHLEDQNFIISKINEGWKSANFAHHLGCSKDYVCTTLRNNGIHLHKYNRFTSSYEVKIRQLLDDHLIKYETNNRKILNGKEIDILVPDYNIAIEINGVYYHQDTDGEKREYHKEKTDVCERHNLRLLHFTDKEIDEKFEFVKSIIGSAINKSNRIYARKCDIVKLNSKDFNDFCKKNHMQGSVNSSIKYGLTYSDELVSVMGLSKSRFNKKYDYELTRFCNKLNCNVIGGGSKLFKAILSVIGKNKSIISYCDRSLFTGNFYEKLGMKYITNTVPNYKWVHNNTGVTLSRYQTQKHKLDGRNNDETEDLYMRRLGFLKIFDSGQKVYEYTASMDD